MQQFYPNFPLLNLPINAQLNGISDVCASYSFMSHVVWTFKKLYLRGFGGYFLRCLSILICLRGNKATFFEK